MRIVACCRYGTVATSDDDKTEEEKKNDFFIVKDIALLQQPATKGKETELTNETTALAQKFKWFECTHTVPFMCALNETMASPKVWWIFKHRKVTDRMRDLPNRKSIE